MKSSVVAVFAVFLLVSASHARPQNCVTDPQLGEVCVERWGVLGVWPAGPSRVKRQIGAAGGAAAASAAASSSLAGGGYAMPFGVGFGMGYPMGFGMGYPMMGR